MDFALKTSEQLRQQIRALRKRSSMTQAQLGAALGVSQARVVEIEATPGAVSMQQIMQVLHVLRAGLVVRVDDLPPAVDEMEAPAKAVRPAAVESKKRGSW